MSKAPSLKVMLVVFFLLGVLNPHTHTQAMAMVFLIPFATLAACLGAFFGRAGFLMVCFCILVVYLRLFWEFIKALFGG